MKVIMSDGGPIIGLDRDHLQHWSGIDGKHFVGEASPYANDYEAAGSLVDGVTHKPCNVAKVSGTLADGLLLSMPLETAVIEADGRSAYIAQVHYADPAWLFSAIDKMDFCKVEFSEHIPFICKKCTYVFFDSANPGYDIGIEYLSFDLEAGHYTLSASTYYPDDETMLTFAKIVPAS